MLEIIAIITLAKKISAMVKEKGLKPAKYVVILVVLWILLEIIGTVIGMLVFGEEGYAFIIFTYSGAALGAFISYKIAENAANNVVIEAEDILDAGLGNN